MNNKIKVLYFSKNLINYKGALYQNDVIDEIKKQTDVIFYGPGFDQYNNNDTIFDIFKKINIKPDCIILGHSWLSDSDGEKVDPHIKLSLDKTKIKKIGILNKEYVNLNEKLLYYKKNNFDLIFSHHHDINLFEKVSGVKSVFWPFAVNHNIFKYDEIKKKYDLSFSGILQNQNRNSNQTDIRLQIQNKLFLCLKDIPFIKKKKYKKLKVFWNSRPRYERIQKIAKIIRKYKILSIKKYSEINKMSKIYINTLSPMGLVSTRFYENMAAKSLVFCEESNIYNNIFPNNCYITFKKDLSDFDKKLFYYSENENERNKIIERAYTEVLNNHTWEKRVSDMIKKIKELLCV